MSLFALVKSLTDILLETGMVVYHRSDVAPKQFGYASVGGNMNYLANLLTRTRRGPKNREGKDWEMLYRDYIQIWNRRTTSDCLIEDVKKKLYRTLDMEVGPPNKSQNVSRDTPSRINS